MADVCLLALVELEAIINDEVIFTVAASAEICRRLET
jgi:hypothetical protein